LSLLKERAVLQVERAKIELEIQMGEQDEMEAAAHEA